MGAATLAAVAFLWGLIAAIVLSFVAAYRHREQYSFWEYTLYGLAYAFSRYKWRASVIDGQENFENLQTGCVIVANHRCSVDPFFIQLAAGKRVHWMVAGEYCKHILFGPLLKLLQVIPTNRGGVDSKAIKMAIRFCTEGRFVGMFPEGRINRTNEPLLTVRPGAALVAMRAKVPLVPIWIEGAPSGPEVWSPVLLNARVRIRVGEPILPPNDSEDAEGSDQSKARTWLQQAMTKVAFMGGYHESSIGMAGKDWKDT
jgi:1-acyl-sn-glycerol-3-phosphate acyltransferase